MSAFSPALIETPPEHLACCTSTRTFPSACFPSCGACSAQLLSNLSIKFELKRLPAVRELVRFVAMRYVYSYAATPKKPASTRIAPTIMRAAAAALCNQAGCVYMRSRNTASGTCAERPTVATVGPAIRSQVICEQDFKCH